MIASFASLTLSRIWLASSNCACMSASRDRVERMLLHRERLRLRLAVDRQPRLIRARQRQRPVGRRAPQHHAGERRHRRVLQIPGEVFTPAAIGAVGGPPRPPPSSSSAGGIAFGAAAGLRVRRARRTCAPARR